MEGVMMAHSSQTDQQEEEIREGVFEWKVRQGWGFQDESHMFKFGRCTGYLKLVRFSDHFPPAPESEFPWTHLGFQLHFRTSLPDNMFSNKTNYKVCLISDDGSEHFIRKGQVWRTKYYLCLLELNVQPGSLVLKKRAQLLPENTFTFRLMWSTRRGKQGLNPAKQQAQTSLKLSPAKKFNKLPKDLEFIYKLKMDIDCIIMVGGEQFPVHRAVLSTHSEVFAAMFSSDTLENRNGVVNIPNVEANIFSDVLYYMYTGHIRGLSTDTAAPMCVVAHKYAITAMRKLCLDFLVCNITIENVSDAALLGHVYVRESTLLNSVIQFIKVNYNELIENNAWNKFSKAQPSIAMEYLRHAFRPSN